jgi:ubiquinone biosynthesis protein
MLRQVFQYQFFHADPHPGNLIVLPDNRLGFVDFGLCDELDQQVRQSQLRYVTAVYSGEISSMYRALTEILVPGEDTDLEAFRRDFVAESRSLESQSGRSAGQSRTERSPFSSYLIGVMRAARNNRILIPSRLLSLYRAILTVETVVDRLGSNTDVPQVGERFFERLQKRELVGELFDKNQLAPFLHSLVNLIRDSPNQINEVLTELADGNFTLRVYVSEAAKVSRDQNRRARLITMAVLSVGVATLLGSATLVSQPNGPMFWALAIALGGLYLAIIHAWSRMK